MGALPALGEFLEARTAGRTGACELITYMIQTGIGQMLLLTRSCT
jgi:hypothetical protein